MDDARPGIAIDATRDQRREPVEHDERAADAEVAARGHLDVTRVDPHARQPEEPVGDDQAEQPRPETPVPGTQRGRRDPGRAPAQPELACRTATVTVTRPSTGCAQSAARAATDGGPHDTRRDRLIRKTTQRASCVAVFGFTDFALTIGAVSGYDARRSSV